MKTAPLEQLVFIDESAAKTNMSPLRGWSKIGERAMIMRLRNGKP